MELVEFLGDAIPPYAILSHTWEVKEILLKDMISANWNWKHMNAFRKIQGSCEQAIRDGLEWIWLDTCCIDKESSAELSEAINSMFFWYSQAKVCYAYLSDVASQRPEDIRRSRWFTRGWTLQELIAPANVIFYNSTWDRIGTKHELSQQISEFTRIDRTALEGMKLDRFSIAKRMSWAAARRTTRKEDEAYCLLGLFNINMPLLYGEGEKAFLRLQQETFKSSRDQSIFAWGILKDLRTLDPNETRSESIGFKTKFAEEYFPELNPERPKPLHLHGFFASSPNDFLHCGNIVQIKNWPRTDITPPQHNGNDLQISLPRIHQGPIFNKFHAHLDILDCHVENTQSVICLLCITPPKTNSGRIKTPVAILLEQWGAWSYDAIARYYIPLTLSNGTLENDQTQLTVTLDYEQLRRTTGYRVTDKRCKSTVALTSQTTIKIRDGSDGRQSVLLFETDESPGDPFVVLLGVFHPVRNNGQATQVQIRVQWVPRSVNPVRFIEDAIAQPFITNDVPKHYDSLSNPEQIKMSTGTDGQLSDLAIIQGGMVPLPKLNFWFRDIDLFLKSAKNDSISFSIRENLFSELDEFDTGYLLRIESIKHPRPISWKIFWTADPHDHVHMHFPDYSPSSHPAKQSNYPTRRALPNSFSNPPLPPSEPKKDSKVRSSRRRSNTSDAPTISLRTKRRMENIGRIWPWLHDRHNRMYKWSRLWIRTRRQSSKLNEASRFDSKIRLRRRRYKKT